MNSLDLQPIWSPADTILTALAAAEHDTYPGEADE